MDFTPLDQIARAWWQPALFALVAVLIALLVLEVGRRLTFRVIQRIGLPGLVARRLERPLRLTLPLVALALTWEGVPRSVPGIGGVQHLTELLLIGALTWAAIEAVQGGAETVAVFNPSNRPDNLGARRVITQTRVISRTLCGLLLFAGVAFMLMTFPKARQFGTSLLASAGVVGVVVGLAARSVFSNILAGLQLALTQPIRIDDVLVIQGEWGRVEELTGTYVVLKIWDERRLIIPLQWFIENPFQNWTRTTSQITGSVFLWVDYRADLEALRAEAQRIAETSPEWDGRACVLQVTDTSERAMQLRLLVSSAASDTNWTLRCKEREGLIRFLQETQPQALPRLRAEMGEADGAALPDRPAAL